MNDHPGKVQDSDVIKVDDAFLRGWPLPMPSDDGDKEERGRVLVIAGSREMPGAVILAATAALRAGAGKLTIATAGSVATLVALAIPESRVIGLPETATGGIAPSAVDVIGTLASRCGAVLIGPGMLDEPAICAFILSLLPRLAETKVVLDACAMNVVRRQLQAVDASHHAQQKYVSSFSSPVLLTPHAGEMAHLAALDKQAVLDNPVEAARQSARRWNALVALKGATSVMAAPDGRIWRHEGGNVGLATSGSGDTLAGIIAGLAARGAPLEQACVWGIALHARAGVRLALRHGPLGYLAGELAMEIPALMHALRPDE
ncbi:NAD(P)H-hydrate dehydratase [Noviherbaspirillum saxi]|uniref:ADP-dependent (S)-NAD(P)H-hydrate dehydratase n=1 Tax=Noviherbaspirillum saxi TaxID=2320863 RepID=A0A3A3FMF0_9BURK|nr:NAD(P)H-hydrate dehydratase [Noviherbaspirillum saxi]RJF97397.1 NAD(P)H-hydrate dehydratase [Noviherbaspirillum saxi]